MEAAGMVLAGLATADLCIKYYKILSRKITSFRNAAAEFDEYVLRVETVAKKTELQLAFLKKIWDILDEELQTIQGRVLFVLKNKLETIISELDGLEKRSSAQEKEPDSNEVTSQPLKIKRFKYVRIKSYLDKAIKDLQNWHRDFDPSWFLMLKVANPVVDRELATTTPFSLPVSGNSSQTLVSSIKDLRDSLSSDEAAKSIFLDESRLENGVRESVAFSTVELVKVDKGRKTYISSIFTVEPGIGTPTLTKGIRELGRKLQYADPFTFNLLPCKGVVRHVSSITRQVTSFEFIFRLPNNIQKPRSLRDVLTSPASGVSLTARLNVGRQVATAASYVHLYGFVHKNIRPETVLVFGEDASKLNNTFLTGFEKFRLHEGMSRLVGDMIWEHDLYRHPQRQGLRPETFYVMQHDIYSLGVCLLEIGLWESLVQYRPGTGHNQLEGTRGSSDRDQAMLSPILPVNVKTDRSKMVNTPSASFSGFEDPLSVKKALVELAQTRLPSRMGDKYTDIVVNCLTCLDEDNTDFGDPSEFEDEDGVLVGVRYIEKILLQLSDIRL